LIVSIPSFNLVYVLMIDDTANNTKYKKDSFSFSVSFFR